MIDVDDAAWGLLFGACGGTGEECQGDGLPKGQGKEDGPDGGGGNVADRGADRVPSKSGEKAVEADRIACPYCDRDDVIVIDGNLTCRSCYTVVGRMLDYGAEWRNYGAEDSKTADPTRCCMPANDLLPMMGCVVGQARTTYSRSNVIDSSSGAVAANIQKYQAWNSMTYRERTLCAVFDVLAVNAAQHGISPCILEEAKSLYKRVAAAKISRGENRTALVACSMYLACKSNKVPRSVKEIAAMFNVRVNAMTKGCRVFQQLVPLTLDTSAPPDFVRRFCSRLGIGPVGVDLAMKIVTRVTDLNIACDSTPPSIVSGAIQMAINELNLDISRSKLAEVCMVSPMTVAKCFKRLDLHRDALLSK